MKTQISSGVDRPAFFHQKKQRELRPAILEMLGSGLILGPNSSQKWIVIYGGVHK